MLQVGDRVSYDGQIATIRYVGSIPNWPGQTAYGVEWDIPSRGKNDGSLGGVRYFQTRHTTSGSFVKASKPHDGRKSFLQALVDKYGDENSVRRMVEGEMTQEQVKLRDGVQTQGLGVGNTEWEVLGFQNLSKITADFRNLTHVSLDHECVCSNYNAEYGEQGRELGRILPDVQVLNLGFNLISDFADVHAIVLQLAITELNLNGNCFSKIQELAPLESVTTLSLASCHLDEKSVSMLCKVFPNVRHLSLASNDISDWSVCLGDLAHLHQLESLDASYSDLTIFPFEFLNSIPRLSALNLSGNALSRFDDAAIPHVRHLDVSGNSIQDWSEIDKLNAMMPSLTNLRINYNPYCAGGEGKAWDDELLVQLVPRLNDTLKMLDGSEVSAGLRESCELYLISKVLKGELHFNKELPRWQYLLDKYRIDPAQHKFKSEETKFGGQYLEIEFEQKQFHKFVLPDFTVGKLKGKISQEVHLCVLDFDVIYNNVDVGIQESLDNDMKQIGIYSMDSGKLIVRRR